MVAVMAIQVTLAINDYDHVRALGSGDVRVEGAELTCLHLPIPEIFFRFIRHREWHVSELSLAKYASLRAAGDQSLVAIPVFPSRVFRHSAIYVRRDGPIDDPGALAGRRVGVPEWTQTATVYVRGLLSRSYGVALDGVQWVQAGLTEPGRVETLSVTPPPGVSIQPVPDRTLNDLLVAGELDAVISARAPADFAPRSGRIVRLFSDARAVEEAHHRETGIFPIMHVVVLRDDVYRAHPWLAMNLLTAFEAAKRQSLARALDISASLFPVPWAQTQAEWAQERFGGDYWPYGIEANRTTLQAFLEMAHEQGVCARLLRPEDLFAPEVGETYRV